MKKKLVGVGLVGLTMAALAACSNAEISNANSSEAESSSPETYNVNMTSIENNEGSEYEIDDMLPRPSDDTFIISVEEAEVLMNKNADTNNDAE